MSALRLHDQLQMHRYGQDAMLVLVRIEAPVTQLF